MEIIIDEKEFKNTKIEAKKWLIHYEQSIKIEDKAFYKTVNLSKIRDLKTKKYFKSGYISTLVRNRRKNKFFVKAPKFTCLIKIIKIIIYMNLLVHILTCNNINIFKMNFSSITLQIKGPGLKKFLYQDFSHKPQNITINNIEQNIDNISDYTYDFNEINNTVTLIWNDTIYNCSNMFHLCNDIFIIDLSNFDTSNVRNMVYMFSGCSSLISLDLSNFDTSYVVYMDQMFSDCSSLISLDLSNFNTSKVRDMDQMFYGCSSLISLNLSNFNTSNVASMNQMFSGCSSLISLDLSNFNTSNVVYMHQILSDCSSLTSLDLSNFDTSKVIKIFNMFSGSSNFEYIKLFNYNNITELENIIGEISDNAVICINGVSQESLIFSEIGNNSFIIFDCSKNFKSKQKKIINKTGECVDSCNNSIEYKYEYNGRCYNNCSNGFFLD